jgi:hypothetical protein
MLGSTPNGPGVPSQQTNQLMGQMPNWRSRLGVGTTGGGVNISTPQQQPGAPISSNPNVAMMIHALMAKQGV